MVSSSMPRAAPPVAKTLLDLPSEVLGQHIVAHPDLDAASRRALFRTSHALARMVLLHAPGSKQLKAGSNGSSSGGGSGGWSSTLVHLLGTKWQPLHLADLELKICDETSNLWQPSMTLPPCPPAAISQHVSHLHLYECTLTVKHLAAWQLHDTTLWPHLQRLAATNCTFSTKAPTNMQQLQPIPLLHSFAWRAFEESDDEESQESDSGESQESESEGSQESDDGYSQESDGGESQESDGGESQESESEGSQGVLVNSLSRLAGNATHVRADLPWFKQSAGIKVLERLQHLTHIQLNLAGRDVLEALLQHPAVQHVTLRQVDDLSFDLSQQACRWRTLTLLEGADVMHLGRLPLANVERLTIRGWLSVQIHGEDSDEEEQQSDAAAGVALLQQLHNGGRLVLLPNGDDDYSPSQWRLQPGRGLFSVLATGSWQGQPTSCLPALVRLVLEAGQAIHALQLSGQMLFRQEVVLQLKHSRTIHTLCTPMPFDVSREGWAGLFGALPPCITHFKVDVPTYAQLSRVKALVQGAVATLVHPLTLTLLKDGAIGHTLEAELMQLAAGCGMGELGGGGRADAQGAPLLTLEVVRR